MTRSIAAALLLASAVLVAGCGVRLRDPEPGTEFFSDLRVSGERSAGAPMTTLVSYEQFYPVEVQLTCELRQNKQTVKEIGRGLVPALPDGSPEATPVVGSFAFDFAVDVPGTFIVECLTPLDEDNYISEEITVAAA